VAHVPLPDGRTIAVEDRGNPNGRPLVFLHSAPGSRLIDPDPWATAGARVRLVTFDRPGYGSSTTLAEGDFPTVAGYADDAAAVIEHLALGRVAVVGWSAGGLVALALAARRPDLVQSVAMVATPAHEDDVSRLDEDTKFMVDALRYDIPGAAARLADVLSPIAQDAAAVLDMVAAGPADDAVLDDPMQGPRLRIMASEAIRQGVIGIAYDIVATTVAPWGFDPRQVAAPVNLWYGEEDVLVPSLHGAWWQGAIPRGTLTVVPGAGHLLPTIAWKQILAAV
jgi:pimeloyl-ACP methyl ester carboxylesterase